MWGLFSLRQGYGGQGDANSELPIVPMAVPPEPAMPVRMCIVGVPTWSPVITRSIKSRSTDDEDNPGIGWFRAQRQCREQRRKRDKYSFHIYKVFNVGPGDGLREKARPCGVME